MFSKKTQDQRLDIKLSCPQIITKHFIQAHGIEQSKIDRQNLTFGKCRSLPLMCLKYIVGSLITHANDAIYHMLAKSLKFSTTKMQCTKDNQEDFIWVEMWASR